MAWRGSGVRIPSAPRRGPHVSAGPVFTFGLALRLPGGLWSGAGVFGWRAGAWFPRLSCVGACLRLVVAVVLAGGDERGVRGRGWWILERVMDPDADWEATG